jgi:hypothetical protein
MGASGIISSTKLSSVSSGGRKGSPKNWDSHLPNERCSKFSDYLLETHVDENSKYPPPMWASKPCSTAKRINNGPEPLVSSPLQNCLRFHQEVEREVQKIGIAIYQFH